MHSLRTRFTIRTLFLLFCSILSCSAMDVPYNDHHIICAYFLFTKTTTEEEKAVFFRKLMDHNTKLVELYNESLSQHYHAYIKYVMNKPDEELVCSYQKSHDTIITYAYQSFTLDGPEEMFFIKKLMMTIFEYPQNFFLNVPQEQRRDKCKNLSQTIMYQILKLLDNDEKYGRHLLKAYNTLTLMEYNNTLCDLYKENRDAGEGVYEDLYGDCMRTVAPTYKYKEFLEKIVVHFLAD